MADVFDDIRARHEGRILRFRNLPCPQPRAYPTRRWYEFAAKRHDRDTRRYDERMVAGWWEADIEIMRGAGMFGDRVAV